MNKVLFVLCLFLSSLYSEICHDPTGWCYDVTTDQAFYFFETVFVDGEIPEYCGGMAAGDCDDSIHDVIAATCNGNIVGFEYVLQSFTTIPVMGNPPGPGYDGYCNQFYDIPEFLYYDASNDFVLEITDNNLLPGSIGQSGSIGGFAPLQTFQVGILSMSTATDCNGDLGGSASIDNCLVCSGGNTGISPNEYQDCTGECYGNAYINECGCVDGSSGNEPDFCYGCINSCADNYDPTATLDDGSCEISAVEITYNLATGWNLIGYSGSADNVTNAIPNQFESSITDILGQGISATQIGSGQWVGSLSKLDFGYGYWVKVNQDIPEFYFE